MKNTIHKNRPVEDAMQSGELWEDPMCYPAYDATSLHRKHGVTVTNKNKDAAQTGAYGVAA